MKAAKMKQQSLLSNISSDLRAPIAGMVGLLEMLYETDGLNDAQKRHIEGVFGSVNSLMLVINDVIDFRSIENGEAKVENSAFVLQDLVRELESIFKGISAAHKGVGFEVDATGIKTSVPEEQKRLVLVGDDTKMKRIAVNILSNAFKYTTRGKVKLSVSIENAQASTVDVRFSIEDTGIGISKEDRLRIFVPLTQMSSQDATDLAQGKSSGTGFGLSIAQQYTELLGGEIGCDSTINAGSTFWFKIPVGRPAPDAEIDLEQKEPTLAKNMGLVLSRQELAGSEESMKSKSKKHKQKVRINIAGTNVMLVEDNWPQQMVMQRRLNLLGCRVVTAPNGQNCLELLKSAESEIDMIFMDLQMPLLVRIRIFL
ncbi:histidine kinase-like ATPase [Geopyxis carbonaria]|nr:histidine kinase-like ATPase [Geopyxis carbonaria]